MRYTPARKACERDTLIYTSLKVYAHKMHVYEIHAHEIHFCRGRASHGMRPMDVHLIGVHPTGVHLIGVHVMGVPLMGVHIIGDQSPSSLILAPLWKEQNDM